MSPRDLDVGVLQVRVRLLLQLLSDLRTVGPVSAERLEDERILRHAVERILSQLVEVAVAVNGHVAVALLGTAPTSYRQSFALAAKAGLIDKELSRRLEPSVGLRNILTHEYVETDLGLVSAAAQAAVVDYADYATAVRDWLAARSD